MSNYGKENIQKHLAIKNRGIRKSEMENCRRKENIGERQKRMEKLDKWRFGLLNLMDISREEEE